jgi:hypothetical protein
VFAFPPPHDFHAVSGELVVPTIYVIMKSLPPAPHTSSWCSALRTHNFTFAQLDIVLFLYPLLDNFILGSASYSQVNSFNYLGYIIDGLCGPVVKVPGYRSRGPGSIPGATRFSEK